MVDYDRLSPPFGLRPLTGIVNDEWIEVRQGRKHGFREAFGRQGQRLSGEPFERAVLAQMNHGVGSELFGEPRICREIAVRRHQCRIVIGRFRVNVVAARRLDQHGDIAGAETGNGEAAAIEPAGPKKWISLGGAPALCYRPLYRHRQACEKSRIVGERQRLLGRSTGIPVGRTIEQTVDQFFRIVRRVRDPVAGPCQRAQDRDRRSRRVEADTVADPAVAVGIIGEDHRDAAFRRWFRAQPRPIAREIGDKRDTVSHRLVADEIGLGLGIAAEGRLERHRPRENAPVDLRKRDIHREVPRTESSRSGTPALLVAAGKDYLQNRAVRP